MTPCFDWNFDLVLEGSTTKIKDKQVPGMCIYVYIYIGKCYQDDSSFRNLTFVHDYPPGSEHISHLGKKIYFSSLEGISNNLMWVFPKIGVPENGWFIIENPIKLDDWGVSLFSEPSMYLHPHSSQKSPSSAPRFFDRFVSKGCSFTLKSHNHGSGKCVPQILVSFHSG